MRAFLSLLSLLVLFSLPSTALSKDPKSYTCSEPLGVRLSQVGEDFNLDPDKMTNITPVVTLVDKNLTINYIDSGKNDILDRGEIINYKTVSSVGDEFINGVWVNNESKSTIELVSFYPDNGLLFITQNKS